MTRKIDLTTVINHHLPTVNMQFNLHISHRLTIGFLAVIFIILTACENNVPFPAGPNEDTRIQTIVVPDTTGMNIPDQAITVKQAIAIGDSIGIGNTTSQYYYIKGYIKKFGSKHTDGMNSYGNAIFYMYDGMAGGRDFEAYQIYNINGERFTSLEQLAVNDYVVVYSRITNYNKTIETPGKGDGHLYASNNKKVYEDFSPEIVIDTTNAISCQQAVDMASGYAVVVGYAISVQAKSGGQQTVWMHDDSKATKGIFEAYFCNVKGEVKVGDYIAVEGNITVYNSTTEIKNGNMMVLRSAPKQYDYLYETFADNIGGFTVINQGLYNNDIWSYQSGDIPCMQAQAVDEDGMPYNAESWLVSPAIDLTDAQAPTLSFAHYHQNATDAANELRLKISRDGENWTDVEIPTYSGGKKPTYVNSGDIDLSALAGADQARIAFVYSSEADNAPKWCINNILVSEFK
ncbi:MAG: DUF5017 domain-containing protein [Paludibacteraceae bacterium]|nr:DUF5017 domain-containing protein [Paludibacteraceae bacterium]